MKHAEVFALVMVITAITVRETESVLEQMRAFRLGIKQVKSLSILIVYKFKQVLRQRLPSFFRIEI